jgi:hypothetical protein
MDGDASYLSAADAPLAQILAHTCFALALARTSVSASGVARAARLLVDVGGSQHSEVNRPPWDVARYRELARQSGGRQAAAYLRLLWDGTALEVEAERTGEALGAAGFVQADLDDRDARLLDLPPGAVREVVAWAAAFAQAATTSASPTCRELAARQRAQLELALGSAAVP